MVIFERNIGHLTETSISIQSTTSIGVFSLGGNDENITLVSTGCMTVWERDGITHRRPLLVQFFCPSSYFSGDSHPKKCLNSRYSPGKFKGGKSGSQGRI